MELLGKRVPRADEIKSASQSLHVPGTTWKWHDKKRGIAINDLGQLGTFPTEGSLPAPTKKPPVRSDVVKMGEDPASPGNVSVTVVNTVNSPAGSGKVLDEIKESILKSIRDELTRQSGLFRAFNPEPNQRKEYLEAHPNPYGHKALMVQSEMSLLEGTHPKQLHISGCAPVGQPLATLNIRAYTPDRKAIEIAEIRAFARVRARMYEVFAAMVRNECDLYNKDPITVDHVFKALDQLDQRDLENKEDAAPQQGYHNNGPDRGDFSRVKSCGLSWESGDYRLVMSFRDGSQLHRNSSAAVALYDAYKASLA